MKPNSPISTAAGALLGIALGLVSMQTISYSAAIATPAAFFAHPVWLGSKVAPLLVWDLFVVYGLGVGLLLLMVAAFLGLRFTRPLSAALAAGATCWLTLLVGGTLAAGAPLGSMFDRAWWGYTLEVVIFGTVIVSAWTFARLSAYNKSLQRTAGGGR